MAKRLSRQHASECSRALFPAAVLSLSDPPKEGSPVSSGVYAVCEGFCARRFAVCPYDARVLEPPKRRGGRQRVKGGLKRAQHLFTLSCRQMVYTLPVVRLQRAGQTEWETWNRPV